MLNLRDDYYSDTMKRFFSAVMLLSALSGVSADKSVPQDAQGAAPVSAGEKVVRILAIGNSFSEDAVDQYFHEICEAAGKRVVVGDLYIPG